MNRKHGMRLHPLYHTWAGMLVPEGALFVTASVFGLLFTLAVIGTIALGRCAAKVYSRMTARRVKS